MAKEFSLDKIYTKIYTKKELLKCIDACYDKEFIVTFLPRTHDNADILIRSLEVQLKKSKDTLRESSEVKE